LLDLVVDERTVERPGSVLWEGLPV
jgi:hypothetical protein